MLGAIINFFVMVVQLFTEDPYTQMTALLTEEEIAKTQALSLANENVKK
jgi:hypothetical protein